MRFLLPQIGCFGGFSHTLILLKDVPTKRIKSGASKITGGEFFLAPIVLFLVSRLQSICHALESHHLGSDWNISAPGFLWNYTFCFMYRWETHDLIKTSGINEALRTGESSCPEVSNKASGSNPVLLFFSLLMWHSIDIKCVIFCQRQALTKTNYQETSRLIYWRCFCHCG